MQVNAGTNYLWQKGHFPHRQRRAGCSTFKNSFNCHRPERLVDGSRLKDLFSGGVVFKAQKFQTANNIIFGAQKKGASE
jgi:hypothetical protein